MAKVDILIPAAGASRRMRGSDKLIEPVDGVAQLRRAAAMAVPVATETGGRVLVTLPATGPMAPSRRQALVGLQITVLSISDAHEGLAASLRAGASAVVGADGLMVFPADMPEITEADLRLLASVFAKDTHNALRATAGGGAAGHPVIIPRRLLGELSVISGDQGGRMVLAGEEIRYCRLADNRATTDLDTPEDWAAWRARTGR